MSDSVEIQQLREKCERLEADATCMREALNKASVSGARIYRRDGYYLARQDGCCPVCLEFVHSPNCEIGKALSSTSGLDLLARVKKMEEALLQILQYCGGDICYNYQDIHNINQMVKQALNKGDK